MTNIRDKKRCMFTKDETMLIINLWKDDKIQNKFKSTLKHNFIWEQLSRELKEFGYNKTGDEIKRKIQNLKHEYKAIKQISGFSLKSWPYYNVMKDLMERKISEKNNVHVEDDHDYVESEVQEIDEQSSSGSWMLMELKDISETNSDNFQEVEDTINTITIENLDESDAQSDVNMIEMDNTIIKTKTKNESILKNPLIFSQGKNDETQSNKTLPVRKSRRPLRFKAHPDRRILQTPHLAPHSHSYLHSHPVTEDRVMERIDDRERRINEREVRLEERERRIEDRERRIDERERRIDERERHLRERERRFEERDRKYEERETSSSTAMCRFFDTCAQFLNQYTSPVINQNCEVDDTQTF